MPNSTICNMNTVRWPLLRFGRNGRGIDLGRTWGNASFEWSEGQVWLGRLWIPLAALLLMPFPAFGWPIPERAMPIAWILAVGAIVACGRIARASIPFALLIVWAGVRAAYHAFPMRTLQVLALVLMAGMLYVAARDLPDRFARFTAWALIVGLAWEWVIGALNAMGYYPWMAWVHPDHISKPMAFLTHPNYFGSIMALGLPIVWALLGIPAAILVFVLILKTISGGPVIAAAAGALVMGWPLLGKRLRWLVAGIGVASVVGVMTLHEWRLSGRAEVWLLALKNEILRWPVTGQGLGQWRTWAEDWNRANYAPAAGKTFMVTLQAHSEPLQLWFELGLIGVILAGLWGLQAFLAAKQVWRAAPAAMIPSPWFQWGRAPLERAWVAVLAVAAVNMLGSPTFHLPGQAAITLLALARVQADAEALGQLPVRATGEHMPKRRRKERQHEPVG